MDDLALEADRSRVSQIELQVSGVEAALAAARKAWTQSTTELTSAEATLLSAEAGVRSLERGLAETTPPVAPVPLLEELLQQAAERRQAATALERQLREAWTIASTVGAQQTQLVQGIERRVAAVEAGALGVAPTPEELAVAESDAVSAEREVPERLTSAATCATALARAQTSLTASNGHLQLRRTQLRSVEETALQMREDISTIRGSLAALTSAAPGDNLQHSLTEARDDLSLRTSKAATALKVAEAMVTTLNALIESSKARRVDEERASVEGGLTRAQARVERAKAALAALQSIERELHAASARAAQGAVERGTRAVQEVFRAVNPHGHLNLVELFGDGTVRIKDSEAGQVDVPAEPYSSTGQLNSVHQALEWVG